MTTAFVDFKELCATYSMPQIVQMLGLQMKQAGPDQLRGPCPACQQGGERALSINTAGKGFRCFAAHADDKTGKGDIISLVAHIAGKTNRDAAQQIATHFRFTGNGAQVPNRSSTEPQAPQRKQSFDADAYAKGLEPEHEFLQPLGITAETLRAYRSGYAKAGVNRGRLALAMCDAQGNILGFCGRSLTEPQIIYPNGLDPSSIIFGADHVAGEVRLVRDVLDVLSAFETGESAVCFLTPCIEPEQCERLAALLDAKQAKLFF